MPIALLTRDMQRPELSRGVVLTSILTFWLFYVVIVSLRAQVLGFDHQGELAYRRVIVSCLGILVTIVLWQIIRLFDHKTLSTRIIATIVAALPCAFMLTIINYYVFNIYDPGSLFASHELEHVGTRKHFLQEIAEMTISRYFFFIAWASLYLALGFSNDVRESERRAGMFAKAAQEAELRALRYQVNPHFLFNTLNSLSSLVMKDRKAEAETMIMNLANFFRSSLAGDPSADMPLSDEVKLQQLYLDIEAVRFPERLSTVIDVPKELEEALVPGLILQPIVENAIKHGVARTSRPVTISISARAEEGRLKLTVADDARPASTDSAALTGGGIGLANVKDRLLARFGNDAQFTVRQPVAGGFVVEIDCPLVRHG